MSDDFRHILYASPSHIRQLFSERFEDVSEVSIEDKEGISYSVAGALKLLLGSLTAKVTKEETLGRIHTINFDDEFRQTKKVAFDLLSDESIPSISRLYDSDKLSPLYRFSTGLAVSEATEERLGEGTFLKLEGTEGRVAFEGYTSLDNWGSRSDLLIAKKAEDPFPFEGFIVPAAKVKSDGNRETYKVKFLVIFSADNKTTKIWFGNHNV